MLVSQSRVGCLPFFGPSFGSTACTLESPHPLLVSELDNLVCSSNNKIKHSFFCLKKLKYNDVTLYAWINMQIIIFYRDGVGERQFPEVLQKEVQAVKAAAAQLQHSSNLQPYCPLVTFVVVQKRHHTRLFRMSCKKSIHDPQESLGGGGFTASHLLQQQQQQQQQQQRQRNIRSSTRNTQCRTMNVLPGTVVDDVICHPRDFDFYLCSHAGERGTSRPTHYHMLWDDLQFSWVVVHDILCLVLCGILCRCGNVSNDTSYEYVFNYCHPDLLLVHPLLVHFYILTFL